MFLSPWLAYLTSFFAFHSFVVAEKSCLFTQVCPYFQIPNRPNSTRHDFDVDAHQIWRQHNLKHGATDTVRLVGVLMFFHAFPILLSNNMSSQSNLYFLEGNLGKNEQRGLSVIMDTTFIGWMHCKLCSASCLLDRFQQGSRVSIKLFYSYSNCALKYVSENNLRQETGNTATECWDILDLCCLVWQFDLSFYDLAILAATLTVLLSG